MIAKFQVAKILFLTMYPKNIIWFRDFSSYFRIISPKREPWIPPSGAQDSGFTEPNDPTRPIILPGTPWPAFSGCGDGYHIAYRDFQKG